MKTPINLRAVRHELGKSLDEFAEKIGVNKSTLSRIENGLANCPRNRMSAFCKAYGIQEDQFPTVQTGPGVYESDDIAALIHRVDSLHPVKFTVDDLHFLVKTQRQLGATLHIELIKELLSLRRS